jgi:hypothetical protein
MQRIARIQLIGPLVLLGAVAAAEAAAFALAFAPSSSLLWYLNLEVFSIFRKSRIYLGDLSAIPFAQLLFIAGPLALIAGLGLVLKRNLVLAVASNLSLVYAAVLIYSWHHWHTFKHMKSASLVWVQVPSGSDLYFFAILLIASSASFVASHCFYLRAARSAS